MVLEMNYCIGIKKTNLINVLTLAQ